MKQPIGTIDCTPSWTGMVKYMIAMLQDGSAEAKKVAEEELYRMAAIADQMAEIQKPEEPTNFTVRIPRPITAFLLRPVTIGGHETSIAEYYGMTIMSKEYGTHDENLYDENGNKEWVGLTRDDYETIRDDAEYATNELWAPSASEYHNSTFAQHLNNGTYKGKYYVYSISHDDEYDIYTLNIQSTSLSELDDHDEINLDYSYQDEAEAQQDIKAAATQLCITFEEQQ